MDKKQLQKALKALNLSEASINELSDFIDAQIKEQIDAEVKNLTAKVFGFIKNSRESIKESVLKELEQSEDTYRNSQVFEDLKSMLALEFNNDVESKAVSTVVKENENLLEEVKLLNSSLETLMSENSELKSTLKVVSQKAKSLIKEKNELEENMGSLEKKVNKLRESSSKPFKSSEKAKAISNSDKVIKDESRVDNEFINEETISLSN